MNYCLSFPSVCPHVVSVHAHGAWKDLQEASSAFYSAILNQLYIQLQTLNKG